MEAYLRCPDDAQAWVSDMMCLNRFGSFCQGGKIRVNPTHVEALFQSYVLSPAHHQMHSA